MTNKSKARHGIRGSYRFKLNPTTRAIRNAFVLGASLAMSGTALGACVVVGSTTLECDGVILASEYWLGLGVDDLTIILGGNSPTLMFGTAGFDAFNIYAEYNNINLTSDADIFSYHGDGIDVSTNHGNITISNTGDINAVYGNGIQAYSVDGNIDVTNDGEILAVSGGTDYHIYGINAFSLNGDVTVTNSEGSSVSAVSVYGSSAEAFAIYAGSKYGNATIYNDGELDADSTDGNAYGAMAFSKYGNADITNGENGSITAQSNGYDANASYAGGAYAASVHGDASVTNSGSIYATHTGKYGRAGGVFAYSYYGDATVTNNEGGSISALATGKYGGAVGAAAATDLVEGGLAAIYNYGDINGTATGKYGIAYGAVAYGYNAEITNGGSISAAAKYGDYGDVHATGAFAFGYYSNLHNLEGGSISGYAYVYGGYATAYGSVVAAYYDAGTNNHGDISATATNAYLGDATAIGSVTQGYTATLENYGSISATADAKYGNATAVGAISSGYYAYTHNEGSIDATATVSFLGAAFAIGSGTYGAYSHFYNSEYGDINANAYAYLGLAYAAGARVFGLLDASATNDGGIYADASVDVGTAVATGAYVYSFGDASLTNNTYGVIDASANAYLGYAVATGSTVYGKYGYTYNAGDISAYAYAYNGLAQATGSYTGGYYSAFLNNPGDISATAINAYLGDAIATGAVVVSYGGYATTVNSGDSITAYAYAYNGNATAVGSVTVGSTAHTTNYGAIDASAVAIYGNSTAVGAYVGGGFAVLDNYDAITATAYSYFGYATAIGVQVYGGYAATVINEEGGTIDAHASVYAGIATAYGVYAYGLFNAVYNYGDISATADVSKYDGGFAVATGVSSVGYFGSTVNNYGDITATATAGDGSYGVYYFYTGAIATGIYNYAFAFGAYVNNSDDVTATATAGDYAYASATGISNFAYIYGPGITTNDGTVEATATAGYGGLAIATGIYNYSWFYNSEVHNSGSVAANATADYGAANATGVDVVQNSKYGYGGAFLVNSEYGDVSATANAYAGFASATGSSVVSKYFAETYNYGSISAVANADYGAAYATGSSTYGKYYAGVLVNYGDISAEANAYGGLAQAVGSYAGSKYYAGTYNFGSISAVANADYGLAVAAGSITSANGYTDFYTGYTYYGSAYLSNYGDISAEANAYGGAALAFGAGVYGGAGHYYNGYFGAQAYNAEGASISADAYGYYAAAIGLRVVANYGTFVYNAGSITATATTHDTDYGSAVAVGVDMFSNGVNVLVNHGDITANGNGARIAVNSSDYAYAYIYNYGSMTGSIQTGKYSDYLYNGEGGTWNALQTSYFSYGDDVILNYGTINMPGSTIDMGKYAYYGNSFYNYGTINVRGASSIHMGGNYGLYEFYSNPNPFYNGGVISFLDGATDDKLTVVGDFAGQGDLVMDFNGTTAVADHLYIEGDIIEPTAQRVSGVLRAPPTVAYTEINFAWVFGQSQPGDFTLGTISNPGDLFYTLNYGIVNHINVVGSTTDVYALGVTVSGLSARGVMAASLAPGVQNLWHDGMGTVFQREGTGRDFEESGPALWLRTFTSDGSIEPEGGDERNFGSGGSQNFDQRNSGVEFGFAFHFAEQWSAGLLLGKSDATVEPDTGGRGKIDGDTYGAYITWMPGNGFYGDLSYRHLSFETESVVTGGSFSADGDASGWALEMGYAFETASGWKIEPQLQVSEMEIDEFDTIGSTWGSFVLTDPESVRTRLGVSLRKTYESSEGHSWTPYFSASAIHEDKGDNSFLIANNFRGESDLRGDSGLFEAGATIQSGSWSFFGGINYHTGSAFDGVFGGQIGARYAFGKPAPAPVVAPAPAPPPEKTCADLDDDGDGVNNCNDKCPSSTAGQAIGPDGCPVPLTIDLKGVNFDFDKATLRPDAVAILDEAVAILTKYPELKVEVAGHTDSIGEEAYNQGLSERRARTVFDYLTGHGVDASRLVGPNGYGELKPIDTNDTREGRANNRRTELDVQN